MRTRLGESRGFTLVELLTSTAIIAVLTGLLLPAVQGARESARRSCCRNNLKQIGLGLLNYHDCHRSFPIGARSQPIGTGWGPSWWVGHLPFMEQQNLYSRIDMDAFADGLAGLTAANGQAADGTTIPYMLCPSSTLPESSQSPGITSLQEMPSYVGIAGAGSGQGFVEPRENSTAGWCCEPTAANGWIASGGMLIPNTNVTLRQVTDGTTQTFIVGEASGWLFDRNNGQPEHIDGGWPFGWMLGCTGVGTPPNYVGDRVLNLTTVLYSPNAYESGLPGVAADHGPNNPLLSGHRNGSNMLFVDGHVEYIAWNVDLRTFKELATRDDGQVIDEY